MGCSKSNPKREVYSNTILPQETRKISNRQPNFTPKTTRRIKKKKTHKISRRNQYDLSRNKRKRNERHNSKD